MDSACDVGDGFQRWFRGLPRAQHLFAPMKDDFYIYVVGCLMRYVRIEKQGPNRVRVLRTLQHGFDGVSALESNPTRDVYAMAEKSTNPRVHVYRIDKGRKDPYEPRVVAKLTGINAVEIRALRFNRKDLLIVLTGYPSFSLSIWKWTTEQELMLALCNEPSEFSDLLISPINECHWVEYGRQHLTFYDLQSFTKNDVIRTQIYLPQRQPAYNSPDALMGMDFAMKIISACFTHAGDFYVLDDHYGLHVLNQEEKILNWLCSIGFSFIGSNISQIVPFGDCIAEVRRDGWFMAYNLPTENGRLTVKQSFKLTSNIIRYFQFSGNNNSFYAITEKEGLVEGVENGVLREPFCIPDFMYSNLVGATFIEPRADYCAVLTEQRRVCILDSENGELIGRWRLAFRPACLLSHPVLPFVFCGTNYGCVNILDVRNLKKPKLIYRIYLTKEPNACIDKMAFLSQGRYLICADTTNDRIFLQYGYPFEEFEYLDTAKLPGEIKQFNVPGCGREDLRFQVMVYAKNKVEELCPSYVYNFSCSNDKLTLIASQCIEAPQKAMALAPMKNYLYTYHVEKKKMALTPFCDDNTWTVLQEPEIWIESNFNLDINRMFVQGDKLYSFGEDGCFMIHEAPQLPKKKDQAMTLKTTMVIQTHSFVDGGIAEGYVSLDGSQVITIGFDGTFSRVRIFPKPKEPAWNLLGFEKPKLLEYQIASYSIDQEHFKDGKKPPDRIESIKFKMVENPRIRMIGSTLSSASKGRKSWRRKKDTHLRKKKKVEISTSNVEFEEEAMESGHTGEEGTTEEEEGAADEEEEQTGEEEEAVENAVDKSVVAKKSKRGRDEIRKELAAEAAALRREQEVGHEAITDADIKNVMHPPAKTSIPKSPPKTEPLPPSVKPSKSKSRKDKISKIGSKYKNVKSKVGTHIRGEDVVKETKEEEESGGSSDDTKTEKSEQIPVKGQSTALPKDKDKSSKSKATTPSKSKSQKVKIKETKSKTPAGDKSKGLLKGKSKSVATAAAALSKSGLKKDVKSVQINVPPPPEEKPTKYFEDIFDDEDEINIINFSRPQNSQKNLQKEQPVYEGADVDGVFCVSHTVRQEELPAPEFWAKFENTLMSRQHHTRAVKLLEEFLNMIDDMGLVMKFNDAQIPAHQVDIIEFNLDDDADDSMIEKGGKYVQYCHIKMQARNKLRHDRIAKYRAMIWEPFENKGLLFSGFKNPILVNNYPLQSFEVAFGKIVRQCQEERRLELKIESSEAEIIDAGNEFTLNVLKAEVDYVDEDSRRFYVKSIMSMDPTAKFEDYLSSDEGETDDEFLKAVFYELGMNAPSEDALSAKESKAIDTVQNRSRLIKRGKAGEKSATAFGASIPTVRRVVDQSNLSTASSRSTRGKRHKKKSEKSRGESAIRLRMKRRRYRIEAEKEEESETEEEKVKGKKSRKVGFEGGDADEDSDSDSYSPSNASTNAPSKKDFMDRIKPSKSYVSSHGIFGPKGSHSQRQLDVLMEPAENAKAKKKNRKKNRQKDKKRRKERKKRGEGDEGEDGFVVQSDEDPSGGEEEEFTQLKVQRYAAMDEDIRGPYQTIEEIFYGSSLHELKEMHQYKPNVYQYHQFELHSRHQFVRSLWLTMEEIYRLKSFFNKLFDEARNIKAQTLKKMAERNERIREIYYYLRLDLDILDEKFDPREDPSLVFSVMKSEIPIEKYLTAEQRRQEELRRQEIIAARNTQMAKFRRKALKVMMDSRLEIKREEMLVHDVPIPPFMEQKDPMEFTLEEYIQSIEYQEAVEELERSRVELIKDLEAELYKLYRANAMEYNGTDLRVSETYLTKTQFHYNIVMEENRIQRMIRQMRIMDDCQNEEDRVNQMLMKLQDGMKSTQSLVAQLSARKSGCREKMSDLQEKEKELEKRFRKEIGDVGQFFEFFMKNYKKKPKIPTKGLDKADLYETGVKALKSTNIRAFARENGESAKVIVLSIMDLEDPMLMPIGCPRTHWDRFNKLRRERLACEFEIKAINLEMQHITEGLDECKDREEETAKAMAAILAILSHRTDLKNYFIYNTEFQFITGKGNVEINYSDLKAHENSVMTLGKTIEKLNGHIFAASEVYVQDIRKSMLIHRDIREIEWRFMIVHMALADVHQLLHDVNNSKPTKELLRVLRQGVNLDTMYEDRMNLIRYLQATSVKFQKIYLAARRRLRSMYVRQTNNKEKVNDSLKEWLQEQNKTASLLKHVGIKSTPDARSNQYNQKVHKFLVKGYLSRKMHVNFQTIDFLEQELARCYRKAFPVL